MHGKMNMEEQVEKLRDFQRRQYRPPSYSEMMDMFGYRSKNAVHRVVCKLEKFGYVRRDAQGRIGLAPTPGIRTRILGLVKAGFPSPAEEELVDTVSLDEYLVENPAATFLLKVSGESMRDAGIHPGDLVLVEKGKRPKKNEIVVAQVDGEWTMKYYSWDDDGINLAPANADFPRIRPRHSLEIGGVVKGVVRKYG